MMSSTFARPAPPDPHDGRPAGFGPLAGAAHPTLIKGIAWVLALGALVVAASTAEGHTLVDLGVYLRAAGDVAIGADPYITPEGAVP